jgi:molybdopterin-guanine dinucleotide biosynthesis protein A
MNIDCIILAGGQSKRMGRDKAFLPFKNKTFLRNILESLDGFCLRFIIVVNKDFSLYKKEVENLKSKVIFVKDIDPYSGPLNGIVSASNYVSTDKIFIGTCDTPILNLDLLKNLYKEIDDFEAVIPEIDGKLQPLNTFYKKDSLKKAEELYIKGKKSLMSWLDNLNYKTINKEYIKKYDENLLTYKSINTPESYQWLLKLEGKIR